MKHKEFVMKKNIPSIILNLIFICFLAGTFFIQYEYLFITRISSLIFAIIYLIVEVKKEYFSSKKPLFILFSVVSLVAITVCISLDETSVTDGFNARSFMILVFVFILLGISYKDLYGKSSVAK